MKSKYFFIENGKEIEIQEFDYNYVQNALLKEYDRRANRKYCYTVIVSRTYDSLGNPIFDVRTLDLNEIYYDNQRLRVFKLMQDKIHFNNLKIKELPMPPLQKEYMEWKEGRSKMRPDLAPVKVDIPAAPVYERKELDEYDPRLCDIERWASAPAHVDIKPMKVLDWIVNMPVCSQEVAVSMQQLSERNMDLAAALTQHSDYVRTITNNLKVALEELFPIKPTFTQRLFGKAEFKVPEVNIPLVLKTLKEAVQYDATKFTGIDTLFNDIRENVNTLRDEMEQGKVACEFQIARVEEDYAYEYELTHERLQKMEITSTMTETNIVGIHKKFNLERTRMMDIQTVTIPLVIMRLQKAAGEALDEETIEIIRNLAGSNNQ